MNDLLLTLGIIDIRFNFDIWQMTLAYFGADTNRYSYPYYYDFGTLGGTNDFFTGFPPMDEYPGMIKTAADFTNWKFKSPAELQPDPDPVILQALSNFVQTRFISVAPEPHHAETCNYVMSHDQRPVIDFLPGYENIAIFALDLGSWFKFTPLVGRILSYLAGSTARRLMTSARSRPGGRYLGLRVAGAIACPGTAGPAVPNLLVARAVKVIE